MSWRDEVDELDRRRAFARGLGGAESIERHHGQGRLTVRERIGRLADQGSFAEVGQLTGDGQYAEDGTLTKVTPAPYVMGTATVDGRPIAVGGEDFTVRGGTSWGALRRKGGQGGFIEDLAHTYKIPLVNLIDGAGGSAASTAGSGDVLAGILGALLASGLDPMIAAACGLRSWGFATRPFTLAALYLIWIM